MADGQYDRFKPYLRKSQNRRMGFVIQLKFVMRNEKISQNLLRIDYLK